jgi:adenylyltransferase/sulfurtransferase
MTSYDQLTLHPDSYVTSNARILVVCDRGVSSRTAVVALRSRGYQHVVSLAGGARGTEVFGGGSSRYDRQTRLVGFGLEGQSALERATITVIGAGGLGCPALSVLAPAGVGTIRIVDFDSVDLSNLHRQPLYTPSDIGAPKVKVAAERLRQLNPEITIDPVETLVTKENALSLIVGSDVVIDATDTFSARAALTEATTRAGIPMVYGSIYGFEGQFAVFHPPDGPCYRCVFPDSPAPGTAIDCSTVGTLGAVTAVIGALEGSAAIQLVAGIGSDLTGTLTMFDARTNVFDRLPISRDLNCAVCGRPA